MQSSTNSASWLGISARLMAIHLTEIPFNHSPTYSVLNYFNAVCFFKVCKNLCSRLLLKNRSAKSGIREKGKKKTVKRHFILFLLSLQPEGFLRFQISLVRHPVRPSVRPSSLIKTFSRKRSVVTSHQWSTWTSQVLFEIGSFEKGIKW